MGTWVAVGHVSRRVGHVSRRWARESPLGTSIAAGAHASSRFYPVLIFHIVTRDRWKRSDAIGRYLLMRRIQPTTSSTWSVAGFLLVKVIPPHHSKSCFNCWSPRKWAPSKPNSERGLTITLIMYLLCSFLSNGRGILEVRGQKWRRRQSPWESSKCQASRCKTL